MKKKSLCFLFTLGVLFLLQILSAQIPNFKIRENLLESANYLLELEDDFHQLIKGDRRTEIHNYADATTLNILYSVEGENLFWDSVMSPFYSDRLNPDKSVTELLVEKIQTERPADTVYDRYWHGMLLVLKPLFLLVTLQQIRWIFLGGLISCMAVLTVLLVRKKQNFLTAFLWIGALMVQFWMTAMCIEYFPVFLLAVLFSIVMVVGEPERERVINLCVVSGVCVAFFDFLTTETLAFVLPLVCVYSIWQSKEKIQCLKEEIIYLVRAGVCWLGAYVCTYLVKWTLASLACGEERFSVALAQFADRQGSSVISFAADSICGDGIPAEALKNAGGDVLPQFLSAVVINIRLLLGLSGKITLEKLALLLVGAVLILAAVVYLFRKPGRIGAFTVILLLLGTIPMLRMMVLNNHSTEHCFFVYRSLYGTIVCYGSGVVNLLDWDFLRRRKKHGVTRAKEQR